MLRLLLKNEWTNLKNKLLSYRIAITNALVLLFAILFLTYFVIIGFYADVAIRQFFPKNDLTHVFTKVLFFYFLIELGLRLLFQTIPISRCTSYLLLPIKHSTLVHYHMIGSLISIFNLVPLALILPFFFKVIWATSPASASFTWFSSVLVFILVNHYLNFLSRLVTSGMSWITPLILIGIGIILSVENQFELSTGFASYISFISSHPLNISFIVLFLGVCYLILFKLLAIKIRYSGFGYNKFSSQSDASLFGSRKGTVANLIKMQFVLILRNRRPRSLLLFSLYYSLMGIALYRGATNDLFLLTISLLLIGIISMTFGQFLLNWDSSFFDRLISTPVIIVDYLKSKYFLLGLLAVVGFILTLPYLFFDINFIWYNLAALSYHIGLAPYFMIFSAFHNTKRIDLTKNTFFNYEGVGINQFIMMIPVFGLPAIFFWPFYSQGMIHEGLVALGLVSLSGLVFRNHICVWLTRQFEKRKYKLSEGFRTE